MQLNELPLYRDTYMLVDAVTDFLEKFPKKYKFTLGDKVFVTALDMLTILSKANVYHADSDLHKQYMDEYINTYLLFRTLIRLCIEKKILTLKQTSRLAIIFEQIEYKVKLR